MRLVFYSVILNHHQVWVADELYSLLGSDYHFVETAYSSENKGGSDYSNRPYLIKAWENREAYDLAMTLAVTSDACVFGGIESLPFQKERLKKNLLSFSMGERSLKKGWVNLFSRTNIISISNYWSNRYYNKPLFKLCCSAFTKSDFESLRMFTNKCFKWGYFTKVENFDFEASWEISRKGLTSILWCARFLSWKHPELPIHLAKRLKEEGYKFHLDMIGSGEKYDDIVALSKSLGVEDVVSFMGNLPNDEVLQQMRSHQVFLFTSDRNEGWGAVANESMSNGCVLVASKEIGSAPYLVKDGYNGFLFDSNNIESAYEKIKWLIENPDKIFDLQRNAYDSMKRLWNPKCAAENLLTLINNIKQGNDTSIKEGPCSRA